MHLPLCSRDRRRPSKPVAILLQVDPDQSGYQHRNAEDGRNDVPVSAHKEDSHYCNQRRCKESDFIAG